MVDTRLGKRYKTKRTAVDAATLDDLFETFYRAKTAEGMAPGTLEKYRMYYRYFCDYLDVSNIERSIDVIDVEVVRSYMAWLLNDKIRFDGHEYKPSTAKTVGLSPVTVNDRIKTLRTMFNFLEAEGAIDVNPFRRVKSAREYEKEIVVMNADQLRRLLKTPDQRTYAGFRDYVLMTILLDGFFRIGEALRIRPSDVNFEAGTVVVRGKDAKNRKARFVPLTKASLKLLNELIDEVAEFNADYIFLSNHGDPLTDDQARTRIKEHAKNAGLRINVHPHLFRHTAATMFLENGGDIRRLQMILGHSDLRMVEKYTHLSSVAIKRQHDELSPLSSVMNKLAKPRRRKR